MPAPDSEPNPDPDSDHDSDDDRDRDLSDSGLRRPRKPLETRLLDAAERRFGKWAIPGLVRYIAILQVLTWVLSHAFEGYFGKLIFNKRLILEGEVWRLVTYLFTPPGDLIPAMGTGNFLILLFVVMFMFMINDGLEQAWEPLRLNLYVFTTMLLMTIAVFVLNAPVDPGTIVFTSLLFAFASYYPNHEILFMLFIPLKIKYLAFLGAFALAFSSVGFLRSGDWQPAVVILVGLLPYFRVFGPGFVAGRRQAAQVADRRSRFESSLPDPGEAFHRCATCGATEGSDPELEFRVAADGEEYCEQHLPAAAATNQ